MAVIKLGDLTTFTGDPSGSFLVINNPTNTATYKIQKEALMSGSFAGTASIALTASYVQAQNVVGLNLSRISSGSATASVETGVFTVNTDSVLQGNLTASNALFTGDITAQRLIVQTISSSVVYSSGSNIFGDELTDVQQMTGSVRITGSLSLASGTASMTSSWAERSISSSYAVTASFANYTRIQESQYRFQNVTVLDQDLWIDSASIVKVVTASGVSTVEYKINAGSYTALSFVGNTWTGSIDVVPNDQLSWRIAYTSGYTTGAIMVVSNITIS